MLGHHNLRASLRSAKVNGGRQFIIWIGREVLEVGGRRWSGIGGVETGVTEELIGEGSKGGK